MVFRLHQGSVAHRVILLQENLDVQLEKRANKTARLMIASSPWRKQNYWVKQEQTAAAECPKGSTRPAESGQGGHCNLINHGTEIIPPRSPAAVWHRSAPG